MNDLFPMQRGTLLLLDNSDSTPDHEPVGAHVRGGQNMVWGGDGLPDALRQATEEKSEGGRSDSI